MTMILTQEILEGELILKSFLKSEHEYYHSLRFLCIEDIFQILEQLPLTTIRPPTMVILVSEIQSAVLTMIKMVILLILHLHLGEPILLVITIQTKPTKTCSELEFQLHHLPKKQPLGKILTSLEDQEQ